MGTLTVKAIEALEKKMRAGEPVKEMTLDGYGLYLRCQKPSSMSFVLRRWGHPKVTLGDVSIGLATARQLARDAISAQERGVNLTKKKREEKVAKAVKDAEDITVDKAIDLYIERYAKVQLRTWKAVERGLKFDVTPRLGKLPLKSITRQSIAKMMDEIVDRGSPRQSGLVYAYLHKMLGWLVGRGYLDTNPADGLHKPKQAPSRERVLSDKELVLIIKSARQLGYPFGPIVELLALTGQRKTEVSDGRWDEIDLEAGMWNLPSARTKNKTAHSFPITDRVHTILKKLPKFEKCNLLFTTTMNTSVSGFSRIKLSIDKSVSEMNGGTPIPEWSYHDLRRTAATGMASCRVPSEVIEMVLNHKSGKLAGVAGVYNRHAYIDEMRDALEKWDSKITALINPDIKEVE